VADGTVEEILNRPKIEQFQVFAPLDHLLQPLEANGRSEIQKRARQGRDRDAFSQRPVLGSE
jgi:hypothetical protein